MPPAATTGTRSPTSSTICGTNGNVATVPVWPPASVPCAITKSQPASTAAIAWRTLPHIDATNTLPSCSTSMISRGTPSPATNNDAPPFTISSAPATMRSGSAASRSTPNGAAVSSRTCCISELSSSVDMVAAPNVPKPPASDTAATRRAKETPPIPASMTGCSMPSISVSRVRMTAMVPLTLHRGRSALVGVIMGSDSDLPVMQAAIDVLVDFGVPHEVRIVSAHRTPEVMVDYAKQAADRGLKVIIAGAGGAAHLPGMTASLTPLPVIGVPVPLKQLDGLDSLLSIVQMPAGIPVATVAVGNAKNAGLLAVRILGDVRSELLQAMTKYQADLATTISEKDADIRRRFGSG